MMDALDIALAFLGIVTATAIVLALLELLAHLWARLFTDD